MKQKVSAVPVVAAVLVVLALVAVVGWKMLGDSSPGPGPEVTKMTAADMMRQRSSGPPPGPPLPGSDRRP